VEQAVNSLDREEGIKGAVADAHLGSLVDKTKANGVRDLVILADTDSAKKDIAAAKTATWQDLSDAVGDTRKDDLESAIANSERAVRDIAKRSFLEPVGEADVEGESRPRRRGFFSHSGWLSPGRLLASIALVGSMFVCVAGTKFFADTGSEGMSMLGDDSEQDGIVLASRWTSTSAREIVSGTQSRNPDAFGC
jgi:hypothetical protein